MANSDNFRDTLPQTPRYEIESVERSGDNDNKFKAVIHADIRTLTGTENSLISVLLSIHVDGK